MTFSESTLRSLNSFSDLCIIQAHLPAHPLCPICYPTFFPFPSFTISVSHPLSSALCQCIFNSPRYWWCVVHAWYNVSEAHLRRWLTPGPLLWRPLTPVLLSQHPPHLLPLPSFLHLFQPSFLGPLGHWQNKSLGVGRKESKVAEKRRENLSKII